MIKIDLNKGGHIWEKVNLVTKTGSRGMYDEYKCKCGLQGKSYQLGTITLPTANTKKINRCPLAENTNKDYTGKIQITKCGAFGKTFENLTPGSTHEIVEPPTGYYNDLSGVWVMGVGEPVKVLPTEFNKISE